MSRHRLKVERERTGMTRVGRWTGEVVLTLLAIFGVVCVAAVFAAWWFGISIMLFKTGSMSPQIPAGSLALVREIPAAEAEIGDVITVDREHGLPITHRVISNVPDPDSPPEGRIIEMRGDANFAPDPLPYHVSTVREVIWSQPGWGQLVVVISQPWALGTVAVLAAGIVTWAFWPRSDDDDDRGGLDDDDPAGS